MKKHIILVVMAVFLLVGCNSKEQDGKIKENDENKNIKVTASTYPMYYIANEIGKDNIDLEILVPMGVDPHEYDISLKEMKNLEDTDLFIYNGSGLEHWGDKISSSLKEKEKYTINASDYVELLNVKEQEYAHEDSHDDHEHGDKDPHIWLDPMNVEKIAVVVKDELKKLDKENSEIYEKNYEDLSKKLKDLDNEYKEVLKNKKYDTILVSHRAFAYLAHRYDLKQLSVTGISPHSEPSPKSLSELIDVTRKRNIKHIFFEVLSSPKSVEMIAEEAKLEVLTLHPIGGITSEQFDSGVDYIDLMKDNLDNLEKALVK